MRYDDDKERKGESVMLQYPLLMNVYATSVKESVTSLFTMISTDVYATMMMAIMSHMTLGDLVQLLLHIDHFLEVRSFGLPPCFRLSDISILSFWCLTKEELDTTAKRKKEKNFNKCQRPDLMILF